MKNILFFSYKTDVYYDRKYMILRSLIIMISKLIYKYIYIYNNYNKDF